MEEKPNNIYAFELVEGSSELPQLQELQCLCREKTLYNKNVVFPYLIFVHIGTPLHYLDLKMNTKKSINSRQNSQKSQNFAFSMLKSASAWTKYTIAAGGGGD